MDHPECRLTDEELARPMVWVGALPYSILSVEELERAMDMELPEDLAVKLRQERDRRLAGRLHGGRGRVRERLLMFREIELTHYLADVQRFLRLADS